MSKPPWISEPAWEVVQAAKAAALAEGAGEVQPQHLFQGCILGRDPLVKGTLAGLGWSESEVESYLEKVTPGSVPAEVQAMLPVSNAAADVFRQAQELARQYPTEQSGVVGMVHLWAGLCAHPQLRRWLEEQGWPRESVGRLASLVQSLLPRPRAAASRALKPAEEGVLKAFCRRNLTDLARQGRLSPAYGMEAITEQMVHCLLRKNRRSLVLTGPAGVGKTKLVEDLSWRIVQHEIPELEGCEVFELDLALLTQGAHLAGSRAERWTQLAEVLRAHPERIILFIDELHTVVGLPLEGQAMDLANAMKPLLVDSDVRLIGATTPEEYQRYIEGDRALARRFTQVLVPEPDRESLLQILQQVAPEFQDYHGVRFSPEALESIYRLGRQYFPNLSFPAKAVELMDDVGVRVKMRRRSAAGEAPPLAVRPEDVQEAVARRLGFELESVRVNIGALLKQKVVGQDHVADKLEDLVILSAARHDREERRGPKAVALFLGPPGVGKSYMAQVLSEVLFAGHGRLLTLDMTEFTGWHGGEQAQARLLGPPPPYVGWEHGGILSNHVLRNPVSVVVIEEFEKAWPEAQNVLLRIFDEGWAQDGRGRLISFQEVYFILTANAAGRLWERTRRMGFLQTAKDQNSSPPASEEDLRQVLREEGFSPELLSRISHLFLFNELKPEDLEEIVRRKLAALRDSLLIEELVWLEYDEAAVARWLVEQCGERPDCRRLNGAFSTFVELPLARWRLQQEARPTVLKFQPEEGELQMKMDPSEAAVSQVQQRLFERVAATFAQKQQEAQSQRAARALIGA